jgi:hypothetical protein
MYPSELIAARREEVTQSYNSAKATNRRLFLEGDDKATSEYIYENQIDDANNIVDKFYKNNRRVVSIQKKTKVGADGLMIEIAKIFTTHNDDDFVVNPSNVRILTGMSNVLWEKDMIDKSPTCFKDKIFHHGKLSRAELMNINNGLIIIDEIDTGDKEYQVLHNTLKEAGVLDVKNMIENNNRFLFISATMIKELYDLYRWGELHELYKMTIPSSYVGHMDFLVRDIVKEFYPISNKENADKWIKEDIIENYRDDYRVHIVRVNEKIVHVVQDACIRNGVIFRNHTSSDRISEEELKELFETTLNKHIILLVRGLLRRANLIPNKWKLRIGATHELCTKSVDNNVQIQGLTGRMSGYWSDDLNRGHKTGPHRTSIKAIIDYEKTYIDPFGSNSYKTSGFKKSNGIVSSQPTMLTPKNIKNMEPNDLPEQSTKKHDIKLYRIYKDEDIVKNVCKTLTYRYISSDKNEYGFKETSLNETKRVVSLEEAVNAVHTAYGTNNKKTTYRVYYPCYLDIKNSETLYFVVIIRPLTDESIIKECDEKWPSLKLEDLI